MRGCSIATTETIHRYERGPRCCAEVTRPATGGPACQPVPATAVFVALLVTGCGTPTNGLEEKSGTEVLAAATAAIDGASGFHVTGTGISGAGR
jgi:hypothetical protein